MFSVWNSAEETHSEVKDKQLSPRTRLLTPRYLFHEAGDCECRGCWD